jgi:hypothetical protein
MIYQSKLFWIDMVMLASVIALIFVKPGKASDVLTGFIGIVFVISFWNHIRYYLLYKKFY